MYYLFVKYPSKYYYFIIVSDDKTRVIRITLRILLIRNRNNIYQKYRSHIKKPAQIDIISSNIEQPIETTQLPPIRNILKESIKRKHVKPLHIPSLYEESDGYHEHSFNLGKMSARRKQQIRQNDGRDYGNVVLTLYKKANQVELKSSVNRREKRKIEPLRYLSLKVKTQHCEIPEESKDKYVFEKERVVDDSMFVSSMKFLFRQLQQAKKQHPIEQRRNSLANRRAESLHSEVNVSYLNNLSKKQKMSKIKRRDSLFKYEIAEDIKSDVALLHIRSQVPVTPQQSIKPSQNSYIKSLKKPNNQIKTDRPKDKQQNQYNLPIIKKIIRRYSQT